MRLAPLLALALVLAPAAVAVEPGEMLADPALEARAREISKRLRCLVCQNQSIDESSADLARDLRLLVRQRLSAGDSDDRAVAFIVDRYGAFVLLRPPVTPATYALWFGPGVILVIAAAGVVAYLRRRRAEAAAAPRPLDEAERRRLESLLGDDGDA